MSITCTKHSHWEDDKSPFIKPSANITYVCEKGHEYILTWKEWQEDNSCQKCKESQ